MGKRGASWIVRCAAPLLAFVLTTSVSLALSGYVPPPNDLFGINQGLGQAIPQAPVQQHPESPLTATPEAKCGPGSNPLDAMQGRVPASALNSPKAKNGYTCNVTLVGHQGSSGGFKVYRYIDQQGHECAFYDTALLYPTNAISLSGPPSQGVAVLDMSNPAHPVQTATLNDVVMKSPHESLNLNVKRGLLAADLGNPATYPGFVSIYDVSHDCRHPIHDSTELVARFGHESGFSPDGKTFWVAATGYKDITAVDVSDPKNPKPIWVGNMYSHGMTIGDDGNRAYIADPVNGQLVILDTSQIQARKPNPQAREISRLTWNSYTIPQNAMPITIHGHHYLLEFDEYAFRFNGAAPPDTVGAARIINIDDETHPYVVSHLRLQVDNPAGHHAAVAAHDPGTIDPAQGYAAHYCGVPSEVDPEIAACSFISSGLRIFDIRDPRHPKEVGYFVAPPKPNTENGGDKSNFAMSKPAFVPERREIWYTDGTSGFYVLRVPKSVWPNPVSVPGQACIQASGRIGGRHVGPVALGAKRSTLRHQLPVYSMRNRKSMDFYCLTGGGIRAGYPSHKLLRSLRRAQRRRIAGRAVMILTADRRYAFDGIKPGTRLRAARRLHPGRGFRIGLNTWYIVHGRLANGLFKVRHGEIQEIGLVNKSLTDTRRSARFFLSSFN